MRFVILNSNKFCLKFYLNSNLKIIDNILWIKRYVLEMRVLQLATSHESLLMDVFFIKVIRLSNLWTENMNIFNPIQTKFIWIFTITIHIKNNI